MKPKSIKMFSALFVLGILLVFSTSTYAQAKGTKVQTNDRGSGNDFSVTKTYEFSAGGIEISPISGSTDFTVYEREGRDGDWVKSDSGKLDATSKKVVEVCKTNAAKVKVEIKTPCEDCTIVRQIRCR